MWSIGGIDLDGRVVLGPLSGYTSVSYRRFMERFGPCASITEMTSAQGLVHNPRLSAGHVEVAGDVPTGVQVFGPRPDVLGRGAAKALELEPRLRFVDINMGCPVRKVNRTGAGCAMMASPELCGEAVRAVKERVDVPVTAKIRLGTGEGPNNFRRVVDELVKAGADAVTVHARTGAQRYAGRADYEALSGLGGEIPVPLIVSGDVFSPEAAAHAMEVAGADAVMVARGGVGNPFLVTRIDRYLRDGELLPEPSLSQQAEWCLELLDMMVGEVGEVTALRRMRSIAPKFVSGCRYSRDYRRALVDRANGMEEVVAVLERIRDGPEEVPERGWPARRGFAQ